MKFKSTSSIVLSLIIALSTLSGSFALETNNVKRVSGRDRTMTSYEASKMVKSDTLTLASAYSFADSLSATNVANATKGKVLLVGKNTDVYSLYKNDKIKKVYVVGNMVSDSVINSARKLTSNIKKLAGADRYITNERTLDEFNYKNVGVADGRNFPDALSASALLKAKNYGLMLVNGSKSYHTNKNVVYTFGDTGSVRQNGGKRLGGTDRYKTNQAINNELGKKSTAIFTSGKNYPDSLSAINIITATDSSINLLNGGSNSLKNYLANTKNGYIVGGSDTIPTHWVDRALGKSVSTPVNPKPTTPEKPKDNPNGNNQNQNQGNNNQNPSTPSTGGSTGSSGNTSTANKTRVFVIDPSIKRYRGENISDEIKDVYIEKGKDMSSIVPTGYKVIPGQSLTTNKESTFLYVVPNEYRIATNKEEVNQIFADSVKNNFRKDKVVIICESSTKFDNEPSDTIPDVVNSYLGPMGIEATAQIHATGNRRDDYIKEDSVKTQRNYIPDTEKVIYLGETNYRIRPREWTKEAFSVDKHKEMLENGRVALKNIGVLNNDGSINQGLSIEERVKKISEEILSNYSYYNEALNPTTNTTIERIARSPYTILNTINNSNNMDKKAVCEGFSYGTSILLNLAGVKVNTIHSYQSQHIWNQYYDGSSWVSLDNTQYSTGGKTFEQAKKKNNDLHINPISEYSTTNIDKAHRLLGID